MKIECPAIRYGRRTTAVNADYYDVLWKSPDFPDDAEALFRKRVCQSVEWTWGEYDSETYPESFLFWKLPATRILVARLSDAGCDSLGRPHAIGIEAIVVETDNVSMPIAEFLTRLMCTPDWSGGMLSEDLGEVQNVETIERYIRGDAASLLLASHPNFHVSGIDRVCSPERIVTNRPTLPPVTAARPPSQQMKYTETNEISNSKKNGNTSRWQFLFFLGCIASVAIAIVCYNLNTELRAKKSNLEEVRTQKSDVEKKLEKTKSDLKAEEEKRKTAEASLEEERKKLKAEKGAHARTVAEKEEAMKGLEDQLTAARKDAGAELNEANEKLKQDNQNYREVIKTLRAGLDNLSATIKAMHDDIKNLEDCPTLLNDSPGEEY